MVGWWGEVWVMIDDAAKRGTEDVEVDGTCTRCPDAVVVRDGRQR